MKKTLQTFLLLFSTLFISCDKNDTPEIVDFIILEDNYEVALNRSSLISIHSGNKDYSIKVEDKDILDAELFPILENTKFEIRIKGKKRGTTTVTITDNINNETEILNVKVISNYISFIVGYSTHNVFKYKLQLFIVNNSEQECVYHMPETEELAVGSYKFTVENDIPYLSLTYTADGNGFTDATIAPTTESFNISDSDSETLNYLVDNNYIVLPKSKSDPIPPMLNMKSINSDIEVKCFYSVLSLPLDIID